MIMIMTEVIIICGHVYVIYKPWLVGVFHKYTTRAQSQRKFATNKPRTGRVRGLSVANFQ